MERSVRGKCPKCGLPIETVWKPGARVAVVRAIDRELPGVMRVTTCPECGGLCPKEKIWNGSGKKRR